MKTQQLRHGRRATKCRLLICYSSQLPAVPHPRGGDVQTPPRRRGLPRVWPSPSRLRKRKRGLWCWEPRGELAAERDPDSGVAPVW